MNGGKSSPEWGPLKIGYSPIEKSADVRQRWTRWKRIANAIIVSVIAYFIAVIVSNLYRQSCEPLSQADPEKIILDSLTPSYLRNQS